MYLEDSNINFISINNYKQNHLQTSDVCLTGGLCVYNQIHNLMNAKRIFNGSAQKTMIQDLNINTLTLNENIIFFCFSLKYNNLKDAQL